MFNNIYINVIKIAVFKLQVKTTQINIEYEEYVRILYEDIEYEDTKMNKYSIRRINIEYEDRIEYDCKNLYLFPST